jgi:pyruvate,water dikinase
MIATGELILWMDAPEARLRHVVGSKASALARVAEIGSFPLVDPRQSGHQNQSGKQAGSSLEQTQEVHGPTFLRISTPAGFVISAAACSELLGQESVAVPLSDCFRALEAGHLGPEELATKAQSLIDHAALSASFEHQLAMAVSTLQLEGGEETLFAVRSSATSEDLVGASFAGQYHSAMAVSGLDEVVRSYRLVVASLFSARAIAYHKALLRDPQANLMAVVVQRMVRSDLGASGVLLSSDPDLLGGLPTRVQHCNLDQSGSTEVTSIEACWGMGDALVGGHIIPERYEVLNKTSVEGKKPQVAIFLQAQTLKSNGSGELVATTELERSTQVLDMDQILLLNTWGRVLAQKFGHPVELEWALDGVTNEIQLVQVRPFTQRESAGHYGTEDAASNPLHLLGTGAGIGSGAIEARVCVLSDPLDADAFREGDVLVTKNTDPSWLPLMLVASALVTEQGGRNSHAAILSRELGLLCVVGCADATTKLLNVQRVRVACEHGLGTITLAGDSLT